MSVIGIGVDLVECSRIERSLERFGEKFLRRFVHTLGRVVVNPIATQNLVGDRYYALAALAEERKLGEFEANKGPIDREFLGRYTVGADVFERYVLGADDGVVKDAEWASARCEIPADSIRRLARHMAEVRTLVTVTWAV